MDISKEYDLFISELQNRAIESFKLMDEYKILQKEFEQMNEACKNRFSDEDYYFITECFGCIMNIAGSQENHVYHQGLRDGFSLLKKLGT